MKKLKFTQIVVIILTAFIAFLFLAPVFFAIISAFKTNGEILKNPVALPETWTLNNFIELFTLTDFKVAIFNSLFLTVVSEILIVIIVPLSSYGIARSKSKFAQKIYSIFLLGMMIPFHMYMFPLFKELKVLSLFGNSWGPIVIYVSGSVSFGTLLYVSFLKGIPLEIEEAAKIDGCSPFKTFWNVVFPLLGPCTASMVVLNGLGIWNDFLMPYLVLPSGRAKTIMVEVYSFVGQYTARWDIVFAGTVIAIIPALIIYVLLQKYFVKGITAGSVK
ncbi:MAG: carbohydrate ABC transporter permease [Lachnospirales bacterium]